MTRSPFYLLALAMMALAKLQFDNSQYIGSFICFLVAATCAVSGHRIGQS